MANYGYIYKTTDLINGKIYIGQRKGKFDPYYLGSGKIIFKAIEKYGLKNFKVELIQYCRTFEKTNERETFYIKKFNSLNPNGYNISSGGHNGDNFKNHPDRDEIISKRTASLRKWLKTEEATKVRSNATKRLWQREDYRKKMTENIRKFVKDPEVIRKKSVNGSKAQSTPEMRLKKSIDQKKFYEKNPSRKEKIIENFKKYWKIAPKIKCKYCDVSSKAKGLMNRHHNDNCRFRDINKEKISKIEIIEEIPDFVYNIEVANNHNYFVNNVNLRNCDDAQNPKKASSEKERINTINFWDHTLYSRLNQPDIGVRINVQQRLHEDDLTGHLMGTNAEEYDLIKIPAEITEKSLPIPLDLSKYYKDNLFWATRFSKRLLNNYLKTLGSMQYAGQLQQLPAPEEGNIVKRDWFDIIEPESIIRDVINEPIHFYLDTSETEKQEGDFTAIVACFKRNNCLYILDVIEFKKEFFEACQFIRDYVYKMKYSNNSKVKIEPKSSGKSIVSQLKATTQLNVVELPSPTDDKLTRLKATQPKLEARRVILIRGHYIEKFLDQLCSFPNAAHDDMVDAFVYSVDDLLLKDDFDFMFI